LYVEPSGEAFPCYAYHKPHSFLGNVVTEGLRAVIESRGFQSLQEYTVTPIIDAERVNTGICAAVLAGHGAGKQRRMT
jgi:hypothetical protein